MKRKITVIISALILIGGCTLILIMNKKKIDEKSKLDGNLESIPVYVEKLHKAEFGAGFEVTGVFSAIHELNLLSEGQGKVVELLFNTGDFVKSGQVLAKLDDELITSQLTLANAALEKARADLKKYEGLLSAEAISGQQVEEVKLALKKAETDAATLRKQLEFTTIKAPIQGTITKRYIEKGSLLMPASPVAEIVDISHLKFVATASETEVVTVKNGQEVTITSTLFPGKSYNGRVSSVGVKSDEARRFPVEIELPNDPEQLLKAGMFGTAQFHQGITRQALLISRNALVGSIKIPRVFVVENGKALLKEITIGSASDHYVEVTGGLKEGDLVVISGQINLDNNTPVKVMNQQ